MQYLLPLQIFFFFFFLVGRMKNQDDRPGLWSTETISISPSEPLNGIQRNLTGRKFSTSSLLLPNKTSTNIDREQVINVLYQVCVFLADREIMKAALASDWLRKIKNDPLLPLNRIRQNLTGCKISTFPANFVFFGQIVKNKMAAKASDWLRHFRLLLCNHWKEFNETWKEAISQKNVHNKLQLPL